MIRSKIDLDGQMLTLFLVALGRPDPVNLSTIVLGVWTGSLYELDEDGGERVDTATYIATIFGAKSRDQIRGDVLRETQSGITHLVCKIGFDRDGDSNSFWFLFSDKPEAHSLASMTKFSIGTLGRLLSASGRLNDGRLYSATILDESTLEMTLYDPNQKRILMFRMTKRSSSGARPGFWRLLAPLIPFFLLEFYDLLRHTVQYTAVYDNDADSQADKVK